MPAELAVAIKPRLRGVFHAYACALAVAGGIVLLAEASSARARIAAAIYATSLLTLFAVSALYHRIDWAPRGRRWMRRLDHSTIFVFMAGVITPFAVLSFSHSAGPVLLIVAWSAALAGMTVNLIWVGAPKWVSAVLYIAVGWVGVAAIPQMLDHVGIVATALFMGGGIIYTLGAVVYASEKPNPWPRVFGYHEIFHVMVIVAAAMHYAAIAGYVVPGS